MMVPARLAEKMSVMSVGNSPFSAHRTISFFSGVTRSPARFAPPRGRGGDRSVPRGCPEPAAPLGPAGGAGSAHPLRTRRLGRGARGGLGLRLACPREVRTGAGTTDLNQVVRPRVSEGFPRDATGKKGYQIHSSAMLLEQGDRTAPKIGKILRAGHQRFSTAFRSRVPFVRGSRGVRRDEAPTISSTDLGDRAEH